MRAVLTWRNVDRSAPAVEMARADVVVQPEWWAQNFYGKGEMNNNNMRAGDLWDPPTQSIRFASNSTSNTRLQGTPCSPNVLSLCRSLHAVRAFCDGMHCCGDQETLFGRSCSQVGLPSAGLAADKFF
eukprot:1671024-Rhodomonas_salina.1